MCFSSENGKYMFVLFKNKNKKRENAIQVDNFQIVLNLKG